MKDHVKARGASPTGAAPVPALAPPPMEPLPIADAMSLAALLMGCGLIWLVLVVGLTLIPQHGGESQRNAPAATIPTENSPPVADDAVPEIRIERNRVVDDAGLRDTNGETLKQYLARKRAVAQ